MTGRDPLTGEVAWSAPFELPEDYLGAARRPRLCRERARRARAARSTPPTWSWTRRPAGSRSTSGMSRGRERNTAYVVTERARAADLSAEPRPAPEHRRPRNGRGCAAASPPARRPGWRAGAGAGRADRHRDDAAGTGAGREPGHAGADLGRRDPHARHPAVRGDAPVAAASRRLATSTSRIRNGAR